MIEYRTVEEIASPLMIVRMVDGVTYDELVEVELHDTVRRGQVLEVNGDTAVGSAVRVRRRHQSGGRQGPLLGHPLQLGVSRRYAGTVFNGMGRPSTQAGDPGGGVLDINAACP